MIRKHIPNAITCLNLASGCAALVFSFKGSYDMVALFVALAAVFDFLDGFAARLLKAYSPMGKELDSLADMISFGLVPGAILFHFLDTQAFLNGTQSWWAWIAFTIPVFSALRLAKFNLDDRQTERFLGLATPANALFWIFAVNSTFSFMQDFSMPLYITMANLVLTNWLMVSNLPMFSFKMKHLRWNQNETRYIFVMGCLILIGIYKLDAISPIIIWYILISIMENILLKSKIIKHI